MYFLLQITIPASQRRRHLSWVLIGGEGVLGRGNVWAQTWGSPDLSKRTSGWTQSRVESQAVTGEHQACTSGSVKPSAALTMEFVSSSLSNE